VLNNWSENILIEEATTKAELIRKLEPGTVNLVIIDYILFDFNNINELFYLQQKFTSVNWVFFSAELTEEFVKNLLHNTKNIGFLLKDSYSEEFYTFLKEFLKGNRYICSHISNLLLNTNINLTTANINKKNLTSTEIEILKEISLGRTTKEIAEKRYISVHTVMTHRKNIFRKIEVNSVHEATKYAMRAGIVEMAEYYI
jgi:DNA-binding NarL/FixJ family response regulator